MLYNDSDFDFIKDPLGVEVEEENFEKGGEVNLKFNKEREKNFKKISPLVTIVREEIGTDYILTGDPDNPVEISVYDLNEKQLADLLRYKYKREAIEKEDSKDDLDEFEIELINAIRSGNYADALSLLGVNVFENIDYTDDDIIEWKIRTTYPDLSDEEVKEEIELWKESPNADKKTQAAREEFMKSLKEAQELKEFFLEKEKQEKLMNEAETISSMIDDIDSLYQFEVDDEVKSEIKDLIFNTDESGKTKIVSMLDDPVGLLEVVTSVALLPKIAGYVNQLLDEIDRLKKNKNIVVDEKNGFKIKMNDYEDETEGVEDVTRYFFLG